jgi:hypothetical protein
LHDVLLGLRATIRWASSVLVSKWLANGDLASKIAAKIFHLVS